MGSCSSLIGVFFLAREWLPQIDFDWFWPAMLIVLGVLLLVTALGRKPKDPGTPVMTSARRGSLIGATWLIGLGIVFLVRQAADLPWSEAWPMFVILLGVAGLISTAFTWRPGIANLWAFTWPIAWIVIGAILLASTTGNLGQDPGSLIAEYWPWVLVILGIWFVIGALIPGGQHGEESLVVPLGGVQAADIRIRFGAGTLTTRAAAAGNLIDGEFPGGVVHRAEGPGRAELSQDTTYGLPWLDRKADWVVGLTGEVPLDLRLDTGAAGSRWTSWIFGSAGSSCTRAPATRACACHGPPA